MAVREQRVIDDRDRLVAGLLQKYPPIRRLEQIMGPEPLAEEAGEVDAFLEARSRWQQPYLGPSETR